MGGYGVFAVLGAAFIPLLYPQLKWYMVLAAFGMAPVFAVANAYGAGVTDWDQARLPPGSGTAPHPLTPPPLTACAGAQASLFGKLGIFAFAAWGGAQGGGVIAGLAVCGVLLSVTSPVRVPAAPCAASCACPLRAGACAALPWP